MWQICQKIADDIIENQQKISLSCYCTPAPCHLHGVIPVIVQMVEEKLNKLVGYLFEQENTNHISPSLLNAKCKDMISIISKIIKNRFTGERFGY